MMDDFVADDSKRIDTREDEQSSADQRRGDFCSSRRNLEFTVFSSVDISSERVIVARRQSFHGVFKHVGVFRIRENATLRIAFGSKLRYTQRGGRSKE